MDEKRTLIDIRESSSGKRKKTAWLKYSNRLKPFFDAFIDEVSFDHIYILTISL